MTESNEAWYGNYSIYRFETHDTTHIQTDYNVILYGFLFSVFEVQILLTITVCNLLIHTECCNDIINDETP